MTEWQPGVLALSAFHNSPPFNAHDRVKSTMASARAVYGPVNPAILGGFDWEDDEDPSSTAGVEVSSPQQRASSSTQPTDSTLLLRRRFNPAFLGSVSSSLATTAPGTAPTGSTQQGGQSGGVKSQIPLRPRRRGERVQPPNQKTPSKDTGTTRAGATRSNNPYAAAIEAKQNAMTVAYLRSPATAIDVTSSLAPDDLGWVPCTQAADLLR